MIKSILFVASLCLSGLMAHGPIPPMVPAYRVMMPMRQHYAAPMMHRGPAMQYGYQMSYGKPSYGKTYQVPAYYQTAQSAYYGQSYGKPSMYQQQAKSYYGSEETAKTAYNYKAPYQNKKYETQDYKSSALAPKKVQQHQEKVKGAAAGGDYKKAETKYEQILKSQYADINKFYTSAFKAAEKYTHKKTASSDKKLKSPTKETSASKKSTASKKASAPHELIQVIMPHPFIVLGLPQHHYGAHAVPHMPMMYPPTMAYAQPAIEQSYY